MFVVLSRRANTASSLCELYRLTYPRDCGAVANLPRPSIRRCSQACADPPAYAVPPPTSASADPSASGNSCNIFWTLYGRLAWYTFFKFRQASSCRPHVLEVFWEPRLALRCGQAALCQRHMSGVFLEQHLHLQCPALRHAVELAESCQRHRRGDMAAR